MAIKNRVVKVECAGQVHSIRFKPDGSALFLDHTDTDEKLLELGGEPPPCFRFVKIVRDLHKRYSLSEMALASTNLVWVPTANGGFTPRGA